LVDEVAFVELAVRWNPETFSEATRAMELAGRVHSAKTARRFFAMGTNANEDGDKSGWGVSAEAGKTPAVAFASRGLSALQRPFAD